MSGGDAFRTGSNIVCSATSRKTGGERPLTVVELIAATTTKAGLTVRCVLDENSYPKGVKVTDGELAALNIQKDSFHPEWNYIYHTTARKRDVTLTQLFRGVA